MYVQEGFDMSNMPEKGSKIIYKGVPFELVSDLRKYHDEIGGGCRFRADGVIEGDTRDDTIFEIEWTSVPAYDVCRRKVMARMRNIESLEHVNEEELYERYGGSQFYHNDEFICNWDQPAGVYRTQVVKSYVPYLD